MRINLYMLRTGARFQKSILRNGADFQEIATVPTRDRTVSWKLFYKPTTAKPAGWTDNVRSIVKNPNDLDLITTQSSSAVLLVRVNTRLFAVTFGGGHFAIESQYIEPGFGLRVTANVVAKDKVTSADTKGFSQRSRSQKTILPAADEFYALGIQPAEDWVRQMGGKVSDREFASTAMGADSLQLSISDFSMRNLPEKIKEISARFDQDDYKKDFGFLDNFIRIDKKDPVVSSLDKQLEQLLLNRDSSITFAAPDPFEQLHIDHYRIQYRRHGDTTELDPADVYSIIEGLDISDNPLHRIRVRALNEENEDIARSYELYSYIQAEIDHDGHRYALNCGAWFRIAQDYLKEIIEFVQSIDDISTQLNLNPWETAVLKKANASDKAEGLYNKTIAKQRNWLLLDKRNMSYGQYQQIEICDLLTPQRELICVKHATQSSTLSHLFSQVSVSASLMHEERYKDKVTEHLRKLNPNASYGSRDDWTFIYAIAIAKSGTLADNLFFFSKVNIVNSARAVRAHGYKVALAKIEVI